MAQVIRYGNYAFNETALTTGLSVVPRFDAAGRTVVANVYNLTIQTTIGGAPMDASVRSIVRQLTKPGFPLIYSGTGLGVSVNIGQVRDSAWGPKPVSCDVKPLGGGNAVTLTWKVQFELPDCADAVYSFQMCEMNFALSFAIDDSGYTTRRYSGFVRVPMTRIVPNSRNLPDSVDYYREQINPPMIVGFRRVPGTFSISPDKCRLDFDIQDIELGYNVPPPGIVHAEASHTVSSVPGKLVNWNCTLSATYEAAVGSGATASTCRSAFFALLKDRVGATLKSIGGFGGNTTPTGGGGFGGNGGGGARLETYNAAVIPVSFTIDEPNLYGRPTVRFSCTYSVAGLDLKSMLAASGQFRPVPGSSWKLWAASMENTLGPRGHANLVFSPGEDSLVDLCGPLKLVDLRNNSGNPRTGVASIPPGIFPAPTASTSWLGWENAIHLEADHNTVPVVTLRNGRYAGELINAAVNTAVNGAIGGSGNPAPEAGNGAIFGGVFGGQPSTPHTQGPDVPPPAGLKWDLPKPNSWLAKNIAKMGAVGGDTQWRKQACWLYMIGKAARAGFAVTCPYIIRWGKAKVVPANRRDKGEGFWASAVGDAGGIPVFAGRWKLRYWCEEIPPGFDLPVSQPPQSSSFFGDAGASIFGGNDQF